MKRIYYLFASIGLTVLLTLSCDIIKSSNDNLDPDVQQDINVGNRDSETVTIPASRKYVIQYSVNARFPEVPEKVNVHTTLTSSIKGLSAAALSKEAIVERLSKTVNFTAATSKEYTFKDGTTTVTLKDDNKNRIECFNNGAVFFRGTDFMSENPSSATDILKIQGLTKSSAKEKYKEDANTFMKQNELMKEGMFNARVSMCNLVEINALTNTKLSEKITNVAVHYGYKIDGIEAWGPGAKAIVYYGADNKVTGYFSAIRNHKAKDAVSIISPDQAVDAYLAYGEPKSLLRSFVKDVSDIEINEIKLVYFMDAVHKNQQEIKPYYLISGNFIGSDINDKPTSVAFEWLESAIAEK